MSDRMAVVRTHGGLGNQLFQILYSRLYCERFSIARIVRAHDLRYRHRFAACRAFEGLEEAQGFAFHLSALRLPKLAARAGLSRAEVVTLPGLALLDGYFQRADLYRAFTDAAIAAALSRLRRELGIGSATEGAIVHIRLGDFFSDSATERAHLDARLADLPEGAAVLSNRDDLLVQPAVRRRLGARGCHHLPTARREPEALLALLAKHRRILANDSTLAVWASILGGGEIAISDPGLSAVHARLAGLN